MRQIHPDGSAIIKRYESLRLTCYLCPAGVPTIGWGSTRRLRLSDVGKLKITASEADGRYRYDVDVAKQAVLQACTIAPNEYQLAAMTSLAFNIGNAAFAGDEKRKPCSVLTLHNKGDFAGAARAFAWWNKATIKGKLQVLAGLVSRRASEAALYLRPEANVEVMRSEADQSGRSFREVDAQRLALFANADGASEPLPQDIEPERPLSSSSIMRAGTLTSAATSLGLASQVVTYTADIKSTLGSALGAALPYVIIGAAIVALAAGLWVLYERVQQRKQGVA